MENNELILRNEILKKLKILKSMGVSIKHNPNMTGMSGKSSYNYNEIIIGRTDYDSLNNICDSLIKEIEEKRNYDPSKIDDLLKEAGY